MTKLTPPHKLESFALIIRAMGGNGEADQRAALNELFRRGLWLSPEQADAAIAAAGHHKPVEGVGRNSMLAELGYCRAPVPLEARPELPLIFRADWNDSPKTGNLLITAVFPTLPGNHDPWTCTCYAHVGQHSACSKEWYRTTRPATSEESADLLRELRSIYERDDDPAAVRLVVVKRWTKHHDANRKAEIRRTGRAA